MDLTFEFAWLAQRIAMCRGQHACPPRCFRGPSFWDSGKNEDGEDCNLDEYNCARCWREAAHNAAKEAEIQYNEPSRSSI